jgi:hypothetical protein
LGEDQKFRKQSQGPIFYKRNSRKTEKENCRWGVVKGTRQEMVW